MRRRWLGCVALLAAGGALACGGGAPGKTGAGGAPADAGGIAVMGMAAADGALGGAGGAGGAPASGCPDAFPVPTPAGAGLPRAASYVDDGDGSVTDLVTGLIWEKTPDPSAQCPGSTIDPPGSCSPAQAAAYCASKGGAWRLPSRRELMTLVDYGVAMPGPTIDASAFPGTASQPYLTASVYAGDPTQVWAVSFVDGTAGSYRAGANGRVRCVSAKPVACPAAHYQAQGDGSVLDAYTGLVWQQSQSVHVYTWAGAQTACASPWRLPAPAELQSIVDDARFMPAIDAAAFPATTNEGFWTSVASLDLADTAWFVSFAGGSSAYTPTTALLRVRCVR